VYGGESTGGDGGKDIYPQKPWLRQRGFHGEKGAEGGKISKRQIVEAKKFRGSKRKRPAAQCQKKLNATSSLELSMEGAAQKNCSRESQEKETRGEERGMSP